MNWDFIKDVLTVLAVLIIVEVLRYYTGLPFTIIDITVFPLSVAMLFFGIMAIITNKSDVHKTEKTRYSTIRLSSYFLAAILFFALGLWAIYEGWNNPLELYTGVKGAAHGYTLLSMGLFISAFSVYYIYLLAVKAIRPV